MQVVSNQAWSLPGVRPQSMKSSLIAQGSGAKFDPSHRHLYRGIGRRHEVFARVHRRKYSQTWYSTLLNDQHHPWSDLPDIVVFQTAPALRGKRDNALTMCGWSSSLASTPDLHGSGLRMSRHIARPFVNSDMFPRDGFSNS